MRISPLKLVQSYLRKATGKRVVSGPFAGLFYVGESIESVYFPKLLGTYEKELHPYLEQLYDQRFSRALVIGAGEGYYAVGIAKKWKIPVLAYETSDKGRDLLTRLALINRTQVVTRGKFLPRHIETAGHDLILVDIEGQEAHLLDEKSFECWSKATIIIEVHGEMIKTDLADRAKTTHHHRFIAVEKRGIKDYPFTPPLSFILGRYWKSCIQEWRHDSIGWMIFEPNQVTKP